ncbi:MAG TPA: fumarylacetoacetase [Gemmatimonadales bacterium]|nr:fumarylacetoacetase [Gemmatimonadales bacterium]
MPTTNETHDPRLMSWVESANTPGTDFPIQNLPLGVFRRRGTGEPPRVGAAIGDRILDIAAARTRWNLGAGADACAAPALNRLMEMGSTAWGELRRSLQSLLATNGALAKQAEKASDALLVPMAEAELFLPAQVGDYTDFYASVHHATNVGSMFRPDNPLLPNYKWVPIGYHGRASSLVASGTDVLRPSGQRKKPDEAAPSFGPTRQLDYELEVGAFIGPGNALGAPIPVSEAADRIFGLCLVNDWSARDVQAWEYQPLGPFLAKNFATTVSPWVVMTEALAPFRAPAYRRPDGDPAPLPHLDDANDRASGGVELTLEVLLRTRRMRDAGAAPFRLSLGTFTDMYWTTAQMVAHHASNGCNLQPGDLLASGTVSGPTPDSRGCLLERTWRGRDPITLPDGEQRTFLEDGDEITMRGWCEREGARRIGFGECVGRVVG